MKSHRLTLFVLCLGFLLLHPSNPLWAKSKPQPLKCMERFDMRELPVGTWGFPGPYVPGKPFFDAEYCRKYRDAGFNTLIHAYPWWDNEHCRMISFDEPLRLAEEAGLKVIIHTSALTTATWGSVQLPPEKYGVPGFLHYARLPELQWLHERHGDSPALAGYLLNDNCGLHDYSIECAEWMLENTPGLFPYMSTCPDPNAQSRVPMPILSSQIYPWLYNPGGAEPDLRRALCASLERDRALANRLDMAPWPIITLGHSPSQIRFQVNACLAYGAQAVWHFAWNPGHPDITPSAKALSESNTYATDVAGPRVLGRRCVAVYHHWADPDIPPGAMKPADGCLIKAIGEMALAGVLVPEDEYIAMSDTPDLLMVVDKRTAKFDDFAKINETLEALQKGEPVRERLNELLSALRADDPEPRPVRLSLNSRVRGVRAVMPDGSSRRLIANKNGDIETPPLRGGEGVLLEIDVAPPDERRRKPETSVWKAPVEWRFAFDPESGEKSENWCAASVDTSDWEKMRTDLTGGWSAENPEYQTGTGVYRLDLTLPEELDGSDLYMHVGAADEEAWVYIDGKKVFDHSAEGTGKGIGELWVEPFGFNITDYAKPGETHSFCIRVRNHWGAGGLYLPVHFVSGASLDERDMWNAVKDTLWTE